MRPRAANQEGSAPQAAEVGKLVRKATVKDVDAIYEIIESFARSGVMLFRSNAEIYAAIMDF